MIYYRYIVIKCSKFLPAVLFFLGVSHLNASAQPGTSKRIVMDSVIFSSTEAGTTITNQESVMQGNIIQAVGRPVTLVRLGQGIFGAELSTPEALAVQSMGLHVEEDQATFLEGGEYFPNDPELPNQWHHHNTGLVGIPDGDIDSPTGWYVSHGSSASIIAIVDSGATWPITDLLQNVWTNPTEIPENGIDDDFDGYIDNIHGIDARENDGEPRNAIHGTYVSLLAAGRADNSLGGAGVCFKCQFIPVKVFSDTGLNPGGDVSNLIAGLDWTIRRIRKGDKITVVNMSLYFRTHSEVVFAQIEALKDLNIPVVTVSGNDGGNLSSSPIYPAVYTSANIITVGAVDSSLNRASFSNTGAVLELTAPGKSLRGTSSPAPLDGTSFAAPLVAGAVGLLRSVEPTMKYTDVKLKLRRSVRPTNYTGWDRVGNGAGILNLCALDVAACDHPANRCVADINRDGAVDIGDYAILSACMGRSKHTGYGFGDSSGYWGSDPNATLCIWADLDADDAVNSADAQILALDYGSECG